MRRLLTGALFLALAGTFLVEGPVQAGGAFDPEGGETQLGRSGGLKYVAEQVTADGFGGNAAVSCVPSNGPWHVTSGGVSMSDDPSANLIRSMRPLDLNAPLEDPDDTDPDDWWDSQVTAAPGTQVTSWLVCTQRRTSYVTEFTPNQASTERTDDATCPEGKHLIGGGSFIFGYVSSSWPVSGSTWRTRVHDPSGGTNGMAAYATCRNLGGVTTVKKSVDLPADSAARATAACPASRHVIGGGGRITGPISEGRLVGSLPRDSSDRGDVPDDQWRVVGYNGGTEKKTLTAYALCVRKG